MTAGSIDRIRRAAPFALAVLFLGSGTLHLIRPSAFASLLPDGMPAGDLVIAVSGVAELVCAVGLLARAPWAGPVSAILLVAVFPGNVVYAVRVTVDPASDSWLVAAAWLRLPLQLPLIWAALQARR